VDFRSPGGITAEAAIQAGKMIQEVTPLVAMSLTAVNPSKDVDGQTVETGIMLLEGILGGYDG
jgi:arginase family enzyme